VSSVTTTTDYLGSYVYTNNTLSFFSSPEGRVVKNGANYEYQYAIADHQGNTRLIFTSATQTPTTYTATFEDPVADGAVFQAVPTTSPYWTTFVAANHTPSGNKVIQMNQNQPIAAAKSLKVYPGDQLSADVWTYYEGNSGYGTTSPTGSVLVGLIASAFGGVSGGGGESGMIYNGVNSSVAALGTGGNRGDATPAAYLNYILFDASYKLLNAGWTAVPSSAYFSQQQISLSNIQVKEAGYIFFYLSYEDQSNVFVNFDDMNITHTKGSIIQYNEYYPFGMQTAGSWTRENNVANNFLGNGGTGDICRAFDNQNYKTWKQHINQNQYTWSMLMISMTMTHSRNIRCM